MSNLPSVYELQLHEITQIRDSDNRPLISVMRVPGGWLYGDKVFVPYNEEFLISGLVKTKHIVVPADLKKSEFNTLYDKRIVDQFKIMFPLVNVEGEVAKMKNWIDRNPGKGRKKDFVAFAWNWINKVYEGVKPNQKVIKEDYSPV